MYYFEKNIQKYRSDTSHLSLLEHGVYNQLIDWYYLDERPIPLDRVLVCRRLCARSQDEINAVASVLADFFVEEPDGWHQKHCDVVVAEYQEGSASAEEGRQHERDRKQRYRDRRSELFAVLRGNGIVPPFDTKMATLERMAVPFLSRGTSVGHPPDSGGTSGARPEDGTAITINNKQLISIPPLPPLQAGGGHTKSKRPVGKSLPEEFGLDPSSPDGMSEDVKAVARPLHAELRVDWTVETLRHHLMAFRAHYGGKTGRDGRSGDWLKTWDGWCRRAMCQQPAADPVRRDIQAAAARTRARDSPAAAASSAPSSMPSLADEASRLGIVRATDESDDDFAKRVADVQSATRERIATGLAGLRKGSEIGSAGLVSRVVSGGGLA